MIERSVPTASIVAWAPEDRWSPIRWHPDDAADGSCQLAGRHDVVGSEAPRLALLVRVPRSNDDVGVGDVAHQPGHRGESHGAGAEHGEHGAVRLLCRRRSSGEQGSVDAAGQRLDEHGALVRHVVGEPVQLRLVGHELVRPAAAGRAAEPDLDARVEVASDEVGVIVAIARRGVLERQGNAPSGMPEHGLEHDAGAVVPLADDLVSRHEREADPVVEVRRRMPLDHREVRTADPRQSRVHAMPARPGQLRRVDRRVLERPDTNGRGRRHGRGHPSQSEPGHAAPDLQRLHRSVSACPSAEPGKSGVPALGWAQTLGWRRLMRTSGGALARPSAGRSGGQAGGHRWPSTSARRATRACGRWRQDGSRG